MTSDDLYRRTLAERLVKIRDVHHMTQSSAARVLGVSRNTLARYESGERVPPIRVLRQYADTFAVSLSWIIEDE